MRYLMLGVVAVVAVVMACSKKNTTGPDIGPPAQLVIISSNGQEQVVGERLENQLVVQVTDADEKPVPDVEVSWSVTSGEGSLNRETSTTNDFGEATVAWTLGTAPGENRARAQVEGLGSVTFTAMALVGPPAVLTLVSGDEQEARPGSVFTDSLVVRIADVFGNPVPGADVTWHVIAGGGSASPEISVTDDAGEARTEWTAGEADTNMAAARVEGLTQLAFTAEVQAEEPEPDPEAETLEHAGGNGQAARSGNTLPEPLVVKVIDSDGKPAPGVEVVWSTGSGTLNPSVSNTNNEGLARSRWTLGAEPGDVKATAVAEGLDPVTFAATAEPLPDPEPTTLERAGGNGQTGEVGSTLPNPLVVQVLDQNDEPMSGVEVVWSVASSGGTVKPTSSATNNAGRASTEWTLGNETGQNRVRATVEGLDPVTFTATGKPEPEEPKPAVVQIVSGNGQTAEVGAKLPNPLIIEVQDQFGKPMQGVEVTWSTESGELDPESSTTNGAGRARTEWILGTEPGETKAAASVDGLESITFSATAKPEPEPEPGPPVAFVMVSGNDQEGMAGTTLPKPLVVRVVDAKGRGVPGVDVAWDFDNPPGADYDGDFSDYGPTDSEGLTSVFWTLSTVPLGSQSVMVLVYDAPSTWTEPILGFWATVLPNPDIPQPATIQILSGNEQVGTVGQKLPNPLVVRLLDHFDRPLRNFDVSWWTGADGCVSRPNDNSCTQSVGLKTDDAGEARVEWTLGEDGGGQTVSVSSSWGWYLEVSAQFTATARGVASVVIVSGNRQEGVVGTELPEPLIVRVLDEIGEPVPRRAVTWWTSAPIEGSGYLTGLDGTGESGGQIVVLTDSAGEVRASWALGPAVGSQSVAASVLVPGVGAVNFRATAVSEGN